MKNSPRASETQSIKSIRQSLNHMKKEIHPVPTVSPTRSDPKALPQTKTTWFRRVVRLTQATDSSGASLVSPSDIGAALGALSSEAYTIKVLGIKAWNVTPVATSSSSILLNTASSLYLGSNAALRGEDYGTSSRLAGVMINIPDLLAASLVTSSTTACFSATTPFGAATTQQICYDVDIVMQM
jgi:hypothetical protein